MVRSRNVNIQGIVNVIVMLNVLIEIDVKMADVEDWMEHCVHPMLNVIILKDLYVE